jgi:RNA polymerase sigma-70 factor (ECF subfamily)
MQVVVEQDLEPGIIDGCRAGRADAWRSLIGHYQGPVIRQMWRFSRDRRVCEELAQEVLVQVYRSLPRYQPGAAPFEHWLRRIATRVGYAHWKRQKRQRRGVPLEQIKGMAAPQSLDGHEAAELLHQLLAQLPPADRLVLTLQYLEECSLKQIADRTGWNVAVVKMRAWRARQRLKDVLEQNGGAELLGFKP